jgi:hypothetical protein
MTPYVYFFIYINLRKWNVKDIYIAICIFCKFRIILQFIRGRDSLFICPTFHDKIQIEVSANTHSAFKCMKFGNKRSALIGRAMFIVRVTLFSANARVAGSNYVGKGE